MSFDTLAARQSVDTHQKALRINLDPRWYGTVAEIGAGQEVARWFFSVGGAAGTVAKTISAYDMAVSDALYGSTRRYVSRQRLEAMLEQEFVQLLDRLGPERGDAKRFFAFADTVATRGFRNPLTLPSPPSVHPRVQGEGKKWRCDCLGGCD